MTKQQLVDELSMYGIDATTRARKSTLELLLKDAKENAMTKPTVKTGTGWFIAAVAGVLMGAMVAPVFASDDLAACRDTGDANSDLTCAAVIHDDVVARIDALEDPEVNFDDVNSGIAGGAALTQSLIGGYGVGFGLGYYDGETEAAVSFNTPLEHDHSASFGIDTTGTVSAGYKWRF